MVVDRRGGASGWPTSLVELLAEAALERGIHSFGASYLAQNRPVDAMLAHVGTVAKRLIAHGVAELAVALDGERGSPEHHGAGWQLPGGRPSLTVRTRSG